MNLLESVCFWMPSVLKYTRWEAICGTWLPCCNDFFLFSALFWGWSPKVTLELPFLMYAELVKDLKNWESNLWRNLMMVSLLLVFFRPLFSYRTFTKHPQRGYYCSKTFLVASSFEDVSFNQLKERREIIGRVSAYFRELKDSN